MIQMPEKEKAIGMYKKMYQIRQYEETIYYLFLEGIMPGTIHQSHGQEACAVGMIYDLKGKYLLLYAGRPGRLRRMEDGNSGNRYAVISEWFPRKSRTGGSRRNLRFASCVGSV